MKGREKCQILKKIRAEIARQNNIDLEIKVCTNKGDCRGTCPRCESELRYLESELDKRRRLKKSIALVGISASLAFTLSGCTIIDTFKDEWIVPDGMEPGETEVELLGEVAPMLSDELMGYVAASTPEPVEKEPLNQEDLSSPEEQQNE